MTPLLVALVLAQQPLPPDAELPPGHPTLEAAPQAAAPAANRTPTSAELMQKLDAAQGLKDKDKPFEVAVSLGRLYFSHGRYPDAVTFLEQAVAKAGEARRFYLEKKKAAGNAPLPAPASVGCAPQGEPNLEKQLALAKAKGKPTEAAACARAALHPLIEVEGQLASSKFLLGDAAGALVVHTRSLELFPSNPEARYGRAAVLLDSKGDEVPSLKLAKADLDQLLADYPTSPHAKQAKVFQARVAEAIAAGGISKLAALPPKKRPGATAPPPEPLPADHPPLPGQPPQPDRPPQLAPEAMQALQNVQVTDDMKQGFARTLAQAEEALATGRYQDALEGFKTVMPFQPDAQVRAGMAWSLVRLGRQPMADNIWKVAAQSPEALDGLGDRLAARGDKDGAKQLWTRLKNTVPAYAPKVEAKLR